MSTPQSDNVMKAYYAERAPVYDRVYAYPERQADLRLLEERVARSFAGRDVLEVAAGTGYWTAFISRGARAITATDATPQALSQLEKRDTRCPVTTVVDDAYALDKVSHHFDGAFAGLWFSHIPNELRADWLATLHSHLHPGATVLLLDNSVAQCARLPITRTDDRGNTYQTRQTDSGETYEVLKNFPTEAELRQLTASTGINPSYLALEHFWLFQYQTA